MDSCSLDLNRDYMDVREISRRKEGRPPSSCRCISEYDDLYLPPSNDLHLCSPRDSCPCDLRVGDSDPIFGNIYLPPSKTCIRSFAKDRCGSPPPYYSYKPCSPPVRPSPQPGQSRGPNLQFPFPMVLKESTVCPEPSFLACIEKLPDYSGSMSGIASEPAGDCSHLEPPCSTCDCYELKCSPLLARSICRSSPSRSPCTSATPSPPCSPGGPQTQSLSSFDNAHNFIFKNLQMSSPRCKDCDCHKPKNCQFCQGLGLCFCEHHAKQQLQLSSQGSPKSVQTPTVQHDKDWTVTDSSINLLHSTDLKAEEPCPFYCNELIKAPRMELEVPCDGEFKLISKISEKKSESQSTQLCCCGNLQCTQPRSRIRINCPFCKCVRSCCCGMCSCPFLTCPSKTPLALDSPTACSEPMSTGGWTEPSNVFQVPRYKRGSKSSEMSAFKSFPKDDLSARVCYSSRQLRTKPSQEQSPTRRWNASFFMVFARL